MSNTPCEKILGKEQGARQRKPKNRQSQVQSLAYSLSMTEKKNLDCLGILPIAANE